MSLKKNNDLDIANPLFSQMKKINPPVLVDSTWPDYTLQSSQPLGRWRALQWVGAGWGSGGLKEQSAVGRCWGGVVGGLKEQSAILFYTVYFYIFIFHTFSNCYYVQ